MFGDYKPKAFTLLLVLIFLTTLACGLGRSSTPEPQEAGPPEGTINVNQEATDRLKQNFNQALQETTTNNEARLRVTNEEITSLVATDLAQNDQIPVSNPQVWFTAGRIYMTGDVTALGLTNESTIVATAVVENGRMVVEVEEATMGMFDFPDSMLESLTQTVNETLANSLVDIEITQLEILEGEMFITGTQRGP